MADFIANQGKGKAAELASRVNANDPANSVLLVALIAEEGVETDAVLKDKDTFTQWVEGATNFATNTGSTRKSIDQSGGITITVDDTNDRTDVDMPDQTFTALANDGTGKISDVLIGYDSDSTGGTDANVVPLVQLDFAITPDGSDVTVQFAVGGFFRAS